MTADLMFSPVLPWSVIGLLVALSAVALALALWRGLSGWALRGLAALVGVVALSGPSLHRENREALSDILLVVVDDSASQRLADRGAQTAAALADLRAQVAARGDMELVVRRVSDLDMADAANRTRLMGAIAAGLGDLARDRVAGVVTLTDGMIHDADLAPQSPAPVHSLLSGRATDWDLRLSVVEAPAFAILGEPTRLRLRVDGLGALPSPEDQVTVFLSHDGASPVPIKARIGQVIDVPLTLTHGGRNLLHITLPAQQGELTDRNNAVVAQINAVRDRLRVLLVSGTPHPGTRTWRNLLKSDSAVDLVHFTILRGPEKQDGVPVSEMSLIAFPTRELFIEKIDEFDLIIFDRYRMRGILPDAYLDAVRSYVGRGGAVLIAAGPDLAGTDSLARSALSDILPARPTGRVFEQAFTPKISAAGQRHPVTRSLHDGAPQGGWGPWMRQVELAPLRGHVILSGLEGRALLVVDRVQQGRVALLASDQAWLWARGYRGGGPQLELLRRLAHWLMGEPELEEEALRATPTAGGVIIERRSMHRQIPEATVTFPDNTSQVVRLQPTVPGRFGATLTAPLQGLYRVSQGDLRAVAVRAQTPSREFDNPMATPDPMAGIHAATGGGAKWIDAGLPELRRVRAGQVAHGRGWIGYTPRNAYVTRAIRVTPIAPTWLMLLLSVLFLTAAWWIEGRKIGPSNRP